MAGPWEKYAAPAEAAPADVPPWAKYAAPATPAVPPFDAAQLAETINRQFAPDTVAPGGLADVVAGKVGDNEVPDLNSPEARAQAKEFGTAGYYLTPAEAKDARTRSGFEQLLSPPGGWSGAMRRVGASLDDQGRALGSLFGLGDRAAAVVEGNSDTYEGRLAEQQKATADAMQRLGGLGSVQNVIGDSLGAAAVLPQALVTGGTGLLARTGYGALGGAAIGAVGGAAQTPAGASWEDMGKNAALHGAVGAGTGAVLTPALSAGADLVKRALATRAASGVMDASAPAVKYASQITGDGVALQRELDNLGPLATLADVNPDWRGVARAAAATPGNRGMIVDALMDRQSGANARLASDLNRAFGPVVSPSQVEAGIETARQATGRQYGPLFQNARAVDTQPLAATLETNAVNLRGPAQAATQDVRGMLNIPGNPGQLDPYPGALFQTRQAIDGMLRTEQNPQAIRALTEARNQVDAELQRVVPGIKQVDSQYAQVMGQREGLQTGASVLDSGKNAVRPEDFAAQFQQAAQPTGQMIGPSAIPLRIQQGTRAEIDRVLGNKANDIVGFNQLVRGEGDWNPQKLATVFGPEEARAAMNAAQREATFAQTANQVARNSETAPTEAFKEAMDRASAPLEIPLGATPTGLALGGLKKGADVLSGNAAEAAARRFAQQLGAAAIAQGPARDRLIQALIAHDAARTAPLSPGMAAVINALAGTRENVNQRLLPPQ